MKKDTIIHAGSALEQLAKVPAVDVATKMELASEAAQAIDTVYESYR